MDRLAWYFHANDPQSLDQAVAVARRHEIDLERIEEWCDRQGPKARFDDFLERLKMVSWDKREYDLGLGIGIANGFATIGAIGFEGRWDYAAIGTVTNLAARLCSEASHGQIVVSRRLLTAVEDVFESEFIGELKLKGLHRAITAFNVLGRKSS